MRDVVDLVQQHDEWRLRRCLNLQPSENVTSEQVRAILGSDLAHRYTLPWGQEWMGYHVQNSYRGTRYIDEIEALAERLAREVFHARHATLKPLSGHLAGMLTLVATCDRGDTILVLDARHGGYDGYQPEYMPSMFGLNVEFLPFDESAWTLDAPPAADAIREIRPKLVLIGGSFILFPYDLRPLRRACDEVGSLLAYDGSHVLGLVAGGAFQDPLREGADILYGSTHKSFFGPQGALLCTNRDDVFEKILKTVTWWIEDNAHWNRIAATAQALLEMKAFGRAYAKQVVGNAKALGRALEAQRFPVRFRDREFTESHQVHYDPHGLRDGWHVTPDEFSVRLEKNDIIVDSVTRLGAQEVTRMGATEAHMERIAAVIVRAALGDDVRKEVSKIRSELALSFVFPP